MAQTSVSALPATSARCHRVKGPAALSGAERYQRRLGGPTPKLEKCSYSVAQLQAKYSGHRIDQDPPGREMIGCCCVTQHATKQHEHNQVGHVRSPFLHNAPKPPSELFLSPP